MCSCLLSSSIEDFVTLKKPLAYGIALNSCHVLISRDDRISLREKERELRELRTSSS